MISRKETNFKITLSWQEFLIRVCADETRYLRTKWRLGVVDSLVAAYGFR